MLTKIPPLLSQTKPWPLPPWAYSIPGHTPQHLKFEAISPKDPGLEGQQATLHACDEVVRWLWAHYSAEQNVDQAIVQKSSFVGAKEGHVVMVFVPLTVAAGGRVAGLMGRELALDSVRALEALVWRYGGRGLECEVLAGGKVKGRIEIEIKMGKGEGGGGAEAAGVESS